MKSKRLIAVHEQICHSQSGSHLAVNRRRRKQHEKHEWKVTGGHGRRRFFKPSSWWRLPLLLCPLTLYNLSLNWTLEFFLNYPRLREIDREGETGSMSNYLHTHIIGPTGSIDSISDFISQEDP